MKYPISAMLAVGTALVAPLAALPAAAQETYARVSAGVVNLRDSELEYQGNPGRDREASFDNGFGFAGALGHGMGEHVRLEGEIAYRSNDQDFLLPGDGGEGSASSWAFMGNAYYDFNAGGRLRPYVGFGLGAALVAHEGFATSDLFEDPEQKLVDDEGWAFAYQAMAGVRGDVSPNWGWNAEYRYFSAAEPKLDDVDGFTYDTDYDSHAVMVGLSRRF